MEEYIDKTLQEIDHTCVINEMAIEAKTTKRKISGFDQIKKLIHSKRN